MTVQRWQESGNRWKPFTLSFLTRTPVHTTRSLTWQVGDEWNEHEHRPGSVHKTNDCGRHTLEMVFRRAAIRIISSVLFVCVSTSGV